MERPLAKISPTDSVEDILREILFLVMIYGPVDEKAGICGQVDREMERIGEGVFSPKLENEAVCLFLAIASQWSKHSGKWLFPVPFGVCPQFAYEVKALWQGEYGDNRRELLKFVYQELQARKMSREVLKYL